MNYISNSKNDSDSSLEQKGACKKKKDREEVPGAKRKNTCVQKKCNLTVYIYSIIHDFPEWGPSGKNTLKGPEFLCLFIMIIIHYFHGVRKTNILIP